MLKGLFGKSATTKSDVAMSFIAAAMAAWKAFDTYKDFKADKAKEIEETA